MKIQNKIFATFIGITTLLGVLYSCSDDYLDKTDVYEINSETYFNSEADYYNALIGAYDLLHSTYQNVLLGEIASDNTLCGGESATDVPGFQQVDDMIHTPVNAQLKRIWDWMFSGVNRAAYILEFQNKTDFKGKKVIIAEARFLHAYYNFELVKWFGAIPLKENARFVRGDELTIPRSPVADVYASIEADLKYAIENLPTTPPNGQIGRATKGAAQALLGRAYLYQDKFTEASTVLQKVINSGTYSLVSDYASIFEKEGENGAGSIFEVQYSDAEGAGFGCLQCSEGNVAVGFNSIRNYSGPTFDSGYSFNVPVKEAVDAYEEGDLRKDVAILDIVAWAAEKGATYGEGYEHTGYYNRKYIARQGDLNTGDQNLTNPNNYRAIRYADVLLMAAEALNRGGINDAKALEYLNQVRTRAFGDTKHNVSASGTELTNAIWAERRVEFLGEGLRFFDLVRTGQGTKISRFKTGKNEVFPIPVEEIKYANGNWKQNPGY